MEMDSNSFDWAHDAYLALNENDTNHNNHNDNNSHNHNHESNNSNHNAQMKWSPYNNMNTSLAPTFSIPPALLTQAAAVEQYGQITPPNELSPADARRDSGYREGSVSVDHLRNEVPWPVEQRMQALVDYQAAPNAQQSQDDNTADRAPKRRRTSSKNIQITQSQNDAVSQPQPEPSTTLNPDPPKRKRGRPKSQPTLEYSTVDGFPFHVSSARQSHLEKNRVAAHKCRQRKKEYINGLEGRAREFTSKNKRLKENVNMLREEVLELKNEVLRHAGCGFWAVDEYLARCAGDLLGMENPNMPASRRLTSQTLSPTLSTLQQEKERRESTAESLQSHISQVSTPSDDDLNGDYGGLELLRDLDDEDMDGNDASQGF